MWQRLCAAQVPLVEFKAVLTSIRDTGFRVDVTKPSASASAVARACLAAAGLEDCGHAVAPVQHCRLGFLSA
jgi:hypothetical protein